MQVMKYYHKKILWMVLFLACATLIMVASLIPYSPERAQKTPPGFRWDYLEHFVVYFLFGSLYILWRSDRDFKIPNLWLAVLLLVSLGFSFLTEFVQLWIPGRAYNILDAVCNLSGVLGSFFVVYLCLIRWYLRKRHSHPEI